MTSYFALLNGQPCTAKRVNNRWMVGGDYDTSGEVIIAKPHKHTGDLAWYTLRGCFLKFSDFVSPEERERFDI